MNRQRAFDILGITDLDEDDEDQLKKSYRAKILQYHPDKNGSEEASRKFQEVREAYAFIKGDQDQSRESFAFGSYDDLMRSFLSKIVEEEYAEVAAPFLTKIFTVILSRVSKYVETKGETILFDYLRQINRPALAAIHSLLSKYGEAFHLPGGLLERIDEIINARESGQSRQSTIVLNPTLEELLAEENIYKLKRGDHTYLVPLWHHEMTFDAEGRDLEVKCFPEIPDNMELDEWNVLSVYLEYCVSEVWNREVCVEIGGRPFLFDGRQLRLTEDEQVVVLEGCGIIYNNVRSVFDAGKKQNIVLKIRLRMDM